MTDQTRDRREPVEDELEETLGPGPEREEPEDTEQQDFATRNVIMSNALPGGSSPVAGAVIGSGGEMGMDPVVDEADVEERQETARDQDGRG